MSTNLNMAAAPVAVAEGASAGFGSAVSGLLARIGAVWREAVALRRHMREISLLSDRELVDIGLAHDEILRLRSSEAFVPRSWQQPSGARGDLPM